MLLRRAVWALLVVSVQAHVYHGTHETPPGGASDDPQRPSPAWQAVSGRPHAGRPRGVSKEFDCEMRRLGWQYAQQLQPFRRPFRQAFEALQLGPLCGEPAPPEPTGSTHPPSGPSGNVLFVDPRKGLDSNPGTEAQPLASVDAAVRRARDIGGPRTVLLESGLHFLSSTVALGPQDSGLRLQGRGKGTVVSGGVEINAPWRPYGPRKWLVEHDVMVSPSGSAAQSAADSWAQCRQTCDAAADCRAFTWSARDKSCHTQSDAIWHPVPAAGHVSGTVHNIWVADLRGLNVSAVSGLQIGGRRVTRARYPNSNPEVDVPDKRLGNKIAHWHRPRHFPPARQVEVKEWVRNASRSFQTYRVGIGGPCSIYEPPVSYWCSDRVEGGGAFVFRVPSGLTANQSALPNSPYADAKGAVVNAWRPGHWANWMFEVGDYDPVTGAMEFAQGGFQGSRGADAGVDWLIENVWEELDSPNEFFYNATTQRLYLFYNGTGPPPSDAHIVAPQLHVLVNVSGTAQRPVRDITFKDMTFTASALTYMAPHGVPSGGDWALERIGAVFLQGTEGLSIEQCIFTRLDGNGLMISGYNRDVLVQRSEFSWIGNTAIASWGITEDYGAHPENGLYGTDGNHPSGTRIIQNLIHEVGLYEKQSSFYMQAKTAKALLRGNVMFNGPRAGINLNDGFGAAYAFQLPMLSPRLSGGDEVTENLVFNTCRESGDHGPLNSWDRQPFVTSVLSGKPSLLMAWRHIHHNFFVANYEAGWAVDNDDGSAYYYTHHNFMVYSGNGMKNDFGGHSNHHHNNVYAFTQSGFGICSQQPGHNDFFHNNYVVMLTNQAYGQWDCKLNPQTMIKLHDNQIFTPAGNTSMCGQPLEEWLNKGFDRGTTVRKWPADADIIQEARRLLWC